MKLTSLFNDRYLPVARRSLKPRTVAEYERIATKLLLPRLGNRLIAGLKLEDAEALHEALSTAPVQANRAIAVLSAVLTFATERGLLAVNPVRGVHRNKETGREFFYRPEQTTALLSTLSGWDDIRARYIALELLTGCRPGELLESAVSWRHGAALRTPDGKTGGRTIFLSRPAEAILDALTPCTKTGRYFPDGMDLRRAWERVVRVAGVPKARLYDLRHTFASAALANGVGLDVIGMMLGHTKRETTLRYAHLAPDVGVNAAAAAAVRMGAGK